MMDRFPPMAAAKIRGSSSRDRENPDLEAMPMITGIRMAAVPVLERKTAHDAGDQHHSHDQLPFGFGELRNDAPHLVGHARFKEGTADDEHGDEQDQVRVHEAGESILGAQHPGEYQDHQGNHGCDGQGKLFGNEQDDDEKQ
jgi:hypothetical protein